MLALLSNDPALCAWENACGDSPKTDRNICWQVSDSCSWFTSCSCKLEKLLEETDVSLGLKQEWKGDVCFKNANCIYLVKRCDTLSPLMGQWLMGTSQFEVPFLDFISVRFIYKLYETFVSNCVLRYLKSNTTHAVQ